MGLLDNITHKEYYQGNNLGNYQFISLDDIISQFEVAYIGENKIIPKANRSDVAFHAQRALQELSFDTFKSIKSQQIDLPPSLLMPLPHDYVNYTKLSWTDSSGIKHPLYPVKETSNPFQIRQLDNGTYNFPSGESVVKNNSFDDLDGEIPNNWQVLMAGPNLSGNSQSATGVIDGALKFSYVTKNGFGANGWGQISAIYQEVDVSNLVTINVSADGVTSDITFTTAASATGTAVGTIRFGLSTINPSNITNLNNHPTFTYSNHAQYGNATFFQTPLADTSIFDINYLEWTGNESSTKTIDGVDVSNIDTLYIIALSFIDATIHLGSGLSLKPDGVTPSDAAKGSHSTNSNSLDNLNIVNAEASSVLTPEPGNETESSTWNSYKSNTPSENNNDDYEDDTYWPMASGRYGLDPQHAQVNGSFFIDNIRGRIHFSSNISGKTVILDYISDSLGTNAEMQVHKFAEDAMYKYIAHAIMSTSSYGQPLVRRFQREKFAAIRKAKLRLSNIKLEELTQILRGKSKQIKH
jgi:hypothetical protein